MRVVRGVPGRRTSPVDDREIGPGIVPAKDCADCDAAARRRPGPRPRRPDAAASPPLSRLRTGRGSDWGRELPGWAVRAGSGEVGSDEVGSDETGSGRRSAVAIGSGAPATGWRRRRSVAAGVERLGGVTQAFLERRRHGDGGGTPPSPALAGLRGIVRDRAELHGPTVTAGSGFVRPRARWAPSRLPL
ncbi:hypothetical protein LC55x_4414 [Lysobacter capsici]|nr:hypothetical protein LC55x_4414 [Lysobacter capsici]